MFSRATLRAVSRLAAPARTFASQAAEFRGAKRVAQATLAVAACAAAGAYLLRTNAKKVECETKVQPPSQSSSAVTAEKSKEVKLSEMTKRMEAYIRDLQSRIVSAIEDVDGVKFTRNEWQRAEGGNTTACVLQEGKVFEKAGVNVSVVHGPLKPPMIAYMRSRGKNIGPEAATFSAAGLSLVMHPWNPMTPTIHMNVRFFEVQDANGKPVVSWFGGGTDLTPSYLFEEDCVHFHKTLKAACDPTDPTFYEQFKKECDNYFVITHRGERRGIGGIFFDDLEDPNTERLFSFVKAVGDSFVPAYIPIIKRRKDMPYTLEQKEWQQIRRGRYVEFNLMYDRGTKFGFQTPGANVENILMSIPLTARWEYRHQPVEGSPEEQILNILKQPKNWV